MLNSFSLILVYWHQNLSRYTNYALRCSLENGNVFLYKFRNRVCSIYLEQTGQIVV